MKAYDVTSRYFIAVVLVMFLWAICFPLIAMGINDAPHLTFATMRAVLAGGTLLAIAYCLGRPMPKGVRVWGVIAAIGFGATTLGFFGMFHAAEFVAPGLATVIANTQPLMAALMAYLFLGEIIKGRGKIGLLMGFIGIVVIAAPGFGDGGPPDQLLGIAYIVLAAFGITASNVLIKRLGTRADPLMAMGWQMVIGSIPLATIALITESDSNIVFSGRFVFSLLALSFAGTALVYWLWSMILRDVELNRANAFSFLIPIFGLSMGLIFFNESLGWIQGVGVTLSLLGIYLVNSSKTPVARAQPVHTN